MRSLSAILFAISYLISAHIAPCAVIVRVIATTPDYQAIIQAAVIGHWKLDEASGSALDSGPNGFDLTDVNTVGAATGQVGGGRDFEKDNAEYFSHADNAAFTPSGSFTICALVKLESITAGKYPAIMVHADTGSQRSYALFYHGSNNLFRFALSANGSANTDLDASSAGAASTGVWYFVAVRHNNGVDIEINVTPISDSALSGSWDSAAHTGGTFNSNKVFRVGGGNNTDYDMDGILDEVGFFDEAISDAALDAYFLKVKAGVGLYGTW